MPLALACLMGVSLLAFTVDLPSARDVVLLLIAAVVLRRWAPVSAGLLGLVLAFTAAEQRVEQRLDAKLERADLTFAARIVDFPGQGPVPRLLVRPVKPSDLPSRIRVSWYDPDVVPGYGECWSLTVRLRRPRGFLNPARSRNERG